MQNENSVTLRYVPTGEIVKASPDTAKKITGRNPDDFLPLRGCEAFRAIAEQNEAPIRIDIHDLACDLVDSSG